MNDPKDIIVSIDNAKEEISLNQSNIDKNDNSEKVLLTEEIRFENLIIHLKESLGKKFYKKTLKEIDLLIQQDFVETNPYIWKIKFLRIRALLKIVKNKIIKYIINQVKKLKIKHYINNIKKYFSHIQNELNDFYEKYIDSNAVNDADKINDLLHLYFEYIYLYSFFHKKIGNFVESISLLSFVIRLHKETKVIVKKERTIMYIEKCFILLSQIYICNEDYFPAIEYLNTAMDLCFKHLIFDTKDINDGIYLGDKKHMEYLIKSEGMEMSKSKYGNDIENKFGNKKIKRTVIHIVFIYFYRGICYESIGKIRNSIKCYIQCLWFINHFFYDSYKSLAYLIKNILDKSLEFKEVIDYLTKKINYYEKRQKLKNKNNNESDKEEKNENDALVKSLCSKKFKDLVNELSKLKIKEIDTVNKFNIKKNITGIGGRKQEGTDKNIFLSEIRLLETYLREDFKDILDEMNKIKSYDLDYSTREKIQKFLRRIYFEQSQNYLNKKSNTLCISRINKKNLFKIQIHPNRSQSSGKGKIINIKKNNILKNALMSNEKNVAPSSVLKKSTNLHYEKLINNKNKKLKKIERAKSALSGYSINSVDISRNKNILSPTNVKPDLKSQTINLSLKEYHKIKRRANLASAKNLYNIDDRKLNNFFNKKYILKRNYIKKLEDREFKFQKCVLKLKDTPKTPISFYNKEVIKQSANQTFQKILSLHLSNPVNWKENLSPEEIKNIKRHNKLQNIMISSLDKNAFMKYKEEEKKSKEKNHNINSVFNVSLENMNNYNKNVIIDINNKIEELNMRENFENKNYQKLLIKNRKLLKYRNERRGLNLHISPSAKLKFKSQE